MGHVAVMIGKDGTCQCHIQSVITPMATLTTVPSVYLYSLSISLQHTKSLCRSFDLSLSLSLSLSLYVSLLLFFSLLSLSFSASHSLLLYLYTLLSHLLSFSHSLSFSLPHSLSLCLSLTLSLSFSLSLSLRQKKLVDEMKAAGAMPGGSQVSQLLSILICVLFGSHFFRIAL